MRRTSTCFVLMCLALGACSTSGNTGQSATTGVPTGAATSTATPLTISAYVLAVNLDADTLTVDPMAFLTGPAAKAAFKHDHPQAQEGPPNDYYISNPTKDSVELKFPPEATVKLVHVGGTDHTQPVAVPRTSLVGYQSLSLRPFKITSSAGSVLKVVEIFVP